MSPMLMTQAVIDGFAKTGTPADVLQLLEAHLSAEADIDRQQYLPARANQEKSVVLEGLVKNLIAAEDAGLEAIASDPELKQREGNLRSRARARPETPAGYESDAQRIDRLIGTTHASYRATVVAAQVEQIRLASDVDRIREIFDNALLSDDRHAIDVLGDVATARLGDLEATAASRRPPHQADWRNPASGPRRVLAQQLEEWRRAHPSPAAGLAAIERERQSRRRDWTRQFERIRSQLHLEAPTAKARLLASVMPREPAPGAIVMGSAWESRA